MFVGFFFAGKKVCHLSQCDKSLVQPFQSTERLYFISYLLVFFLFLSKVSFSRLSYFTLNLWRDATAYCPNRELLIVSVSPAVAHCVAFSTNQSVVILHFLCMHERTKRTNTFYVRNPAENTSKLVKAGLLVLAGVLASLEVGLGTFRHHKHPALTYQILAYYVVKRIVINNSLINCTDVHL